MANVPDGAKKPQDRKAKAGEKVPEAFTFEHDGESHTLLPTAEKITPGFIRKRRNAEELQVIYDALELLASPEQLEVVDAMAWAEHRKFLSDFNDHLESFFGVGLGE